MKPAEASSLVTGQEVCLRWQQSFFLKDQCWKVIENKGPLRKTLPRSENVYEKKGDTS
jgi:hypothetical protein